MRCKSSINSELDKLYSELDTVHIPDLQRLAHEEEVHEQKLISLINEEIDSLENELEEVEIYHGRKRNFVRTADLPFLCW
mgnify:CR=1 FL=1